MGWRGFNLLMYQPGKELSKRRNMIKRGLHTTAVRSYGPLMQDVTERFVARAAGFQGHPEALVAEYVDYNYMPISIRHLELLSLTSFFPGRSAVFSSRSLTVMRYPNMPSTSWLSRIGKHNDGQARHLCTSGSSTSFPGVRQFDLSGSPGDGPR